MVLGCGGRSRILKGGVPLSRTFSTALVRAHEAGDACTQNDKKGDSAETEEPPGSATDTSPSGIYCVLALILSPCIHKIDETTKFIRMCGRLHGTVCKRINLCGKEKNSK